jgi:hypothetical protein
MQIGFGWGKGRRVITTLIPGDRRTPPVFPPNREILEGEPICAQCGSGQSTHDNGTRNHRFIRLRLAKAHLRRRTTT